jgi:hypothetical protein
LYLLLFNLVQTVIKKGGSRNSEDSNTLEYTFNTESYFEYHVGNTAEAVKALTCNEPQQNQQQKKVYEIDLSSI